MEEPNHIMISTCPLTIQTRSQNENSRAVELTEQWITLNILIIIIIIMNKTLFFRAFITSSADALRKFVKLNGKF